MLKPETGSTMQSFVSQLMGFVLVFLVLWKFVWKPISAFFRSHREEIRGKVEETERGLLEMQIAVRESTERLAGFDREAQDRMEAARREGRAGRDSLQAQARTQASAERERARQEMARERDQAILELRLDSVRLTLEEVDRILERSMDDSTNQGLVRGFLDGLERVGRT